MTMKPTLPILVVSDGVAIATLPAGAASGPLEEARAATETEDYAAALALLRPLADQGNAEAQSALGFFYANGYGVALDDERAVFWYRRAGDQGDALAQGSLGFHYEFGLGVERDLLRSYVWYSHALAGVTGALRDLFARDQERVIARMTPDQLAEVRLIARERKIRG
jgi:hypothetical protein